VRASTFRIVYVLIVLLASGLVACGDSSGSGGPPPNIVITIQPQPNATVLPGCEARELESWYEVVGTLIMTFSQESAAGLGQEPPATVGVLNRLIDLRDAIAEQSTPECALNVHGEILLQIRAILTAYQRYVNGDIAQDELRVQVEAGTDRIDTEIAALLAGTQAGLEQQLREERASWDEE
jgi:hypothetical protein